MRTTIDLDAGLLKRIRIEARRRGVTVKELLATLLRNGLNATPQRTKRFRQKTFAMGHARFSVDKALRFAADLEDSETISELRRGR